MSQEIFLSNFDWNLDRVCNIRSAIAALYGIDEQIEVLIDEEKLRNIYHVEFVRGGKTLIYTTLPYDEDISTETLRQQIVSFAKEHIKRVS
jgi:hypothetical protein